MLPAEMTPIKRPPGRPSTGQSINLTVRISPELRAQLEALGNGNVTQGIRNAVAIAHTTQQPKS
jgi:hypothetical protein